MKKFQFRYSTAMFRDSLWDVSNLLKFIFSVIEKCWSMEVVIKIVQMKSIYIQLPIQSELFLTQVLFITRFDVSKQQFFVFFFKKM